MLGHCHEFYDPSSFMTPVNEYSFCDLSEKQSYEAVFGYVIKK
jgi:hypothetical protein